MGMTYRMKAWLFLRLVAQKFRKKTQQTDKNRFQLLTESSMDCIWTAGLDMRPTYISPSITRLLGYTQDEAMNNPAEKVFSSDSLAKIKKRHTEVLENEMSGIQNSPESLKIEVEMLHKKGHPIPFEVQYSMLRDQKGNLIEFLAIARDITERRRFEESLKHSETMYRTIFDRAADGILLMADTFKDCNESMCRIFNCKKEDIVGQTPARFSPEIQPDGNSSVVSANEKIQAAMRGTPQAFYWQHISYDGVLIDAEISLNAVTFGGEQLLQAVVRDVTERKKTERIYEALYAISQAAHSETDMQALYKNIHRSIAQLMPAKNFFIALYDDREDLLSFPYVVDEYDDAYDSQKPGRGFTEFILRKGKAFLIDAAMALELGKTGETEVIGTLSEIWLGVPLKIGGKSIGVIVVQDYENPKAYGEGELQVLSFVAEQIARVIEMKKRDEELIEYNEKLVQINQTKDKLISMVAHDLRGPFHPILNLSEILMTEIDSLGQEEIKQFANHIHTKAQSVFVLMTGLLEWSRIQSGSIQFTPASINLKLKTDAVIQYISESVIQKDITVKNNIAESISVYADEQMIHSVLQNLLSNALKFTNNGGEINLYAEMDGSTVKISIQDNGVGISAEKIKRLFTIDKSISSKGTNDEMGTGLGLLMCKEFVEKNAGKIQVESEVGKGSKFIFTVPAIKT